MSLTTHGNRGYPGSATLISLYDLAGREVSQLDWFNAWKKTEVYAGGRHLATYNFGTTFFNHTDWLGTERAHSDVTGASVQTCTGLAFSDPTALSCTGAGVNGWSPIHFTGDEHDAETNLEHTWFRQYSGTQGRWMSPDPAGLGAVDPANPQTWNRYAYVANNPVNAVDPLGLCPPPGVSVDRTKTPRGCLDVAFYERLIMLSGYVASYLQDNDSERLNWFVSQQPLGSVLIYDTNNAMFAPAQQSKPANNVSAANNGPVVLSNPCQYQGRALSPSDYAAMGQNTKWYSLNFALDVKYGWGTGQYMDAQPLTSVPATWRAAAYGNYVYGVYMQAAGVPLSVALRGAEYYALKKTYPAGTPMQPWYPGLPAANAQNIINGYNAQANGTTCQATTPVPPPPGG